jgi:hypothetical protein
MAPAQAPSHLGEFNKLFLYYDCGPIIMLVVVILSILLIYTIITRAARSRNRHHALLLKGPELIEQFILDALDTYDKMAKRLHTLFILLGFTAIVGSIFVTTFLSLTDINNNGGSPGIKQALPYIAFLSTTCLTLITAFDLSTKSNNSRRAWRYLQNEYEVYKCKPNGNLEKLIEAHKKAEEILGSVDFQYQGKESK